MDKGSNNGRPGKADQKELPLEEDYARRLALLVLPSDSTTTIVRSNSAASLHWLKVLTLTKNAVTQCFSLVKNFLCQKKPKRSPPIGQKRLNGARGYIRDRCQEIQSDCRPATTAD